MGKVMKKRKPVVLLICEGRNKTEKNFFNNFNTRDNSFVLKILDCESTDITSTYNKNSIKKLHHA